MVNIYGSGGGGITSDDVTASKNKVVSGFSTITTDSNDEVVYGTLTDLGSMQICTGSEINGNDLWLHTPLGAFTSSAVSPNINNKAVVYIPLSTLRTKIGYTDASKVLTGTTIAGVTGTMANYSGNNAINYTLPINGSYTIPTGYHNGGKVKQNITTKGATTYRANTSASQTIASGTYLSGTQTIAKIGHQTLNNVAWYGFGVDTEVGGAVTFTMPENGTVFYSGVCCGSSNSSIATCEIYKGNTLINNRNMPAQASDGGYLRIRSTMFGDSFTANKGDIIKLVCSVPTSNYGNVLTWLVAEIIY